MSDPSSGVGACAIDTPVMYTPECSDTISRVNCCLFDTRY